jgi:hypothetical protein
MLEMAKDTTGEFTEDNLVMNVVDLFAAGSCIEELHNFTFFED